MMLVISRFKVAGGKEEEVRAAFLHRPRLVDSAPGFLGMEVFTDAQDPSLFFLVTRWTDQASFDDWHHSEAYRLANRQFPAGLKVAAGFNEISRLEPVRESSSIAGLEELIADSAPLLIRALADSGSVNLLMADRDGTVRLCNAAFLGSLKMPAEQVIGCSIWDLLPESDAASLRQRIGQGQRSVRQKLLLNFVDLHHSPFTLECYLDVQPRHFVIWAEAPHAKNEKAQDEWLRLNNELAVLSRENARKSKELAEARTQLEKALVDLQSSYWHLKKIQEVLPICMQCGKVKTEGEWGDVVKYLKQHALFLSHGYCPDCFAKVMAQYNLSHPE